MLLVLPIILGSRQDLPSLRLFQSIPPWTRIHKDFSDQLHVFVVIQGPSTHVHSSFLHRFSRFGMHLRQDTKIQIGSTNLAPRSFRRRRGLVASNMLNSTKNWLPRTNAKHDAGRPLATHVAVTGPQIVVGVGQSVGNSAAQALSGQFWHGCGWEDGE